MRTLEDMITIINVDPERFYWLKEWREDKRPFILKRDHNECMRCNGKWKCSQPVKHQRIKKAKYVHHIKPLKEYPELCLTDDNLISLCFGCHEDIERRGYSQEKKEPLTQEMW